MIFVVLLIISFENSLLVLDLCYNRSLILTKVMIHISCKNTFVVKKVLPSKVRRIIPGSEYMNRMVTTISDIRMRPRLSILNTALRIIASYCLQSLIGPANLLSAISCYKFHISKDQQENMKFTIICHLAIFFCQTNHK